MAAFGRLEDDVGIQRRGPATHGNILLSAGIDARLVAAAILGLQQANDPVVFELLADRPHQNRAHQTPPNGWSVEIKPESVAWIDQARPCAHRWRFPGPMPDTYRVGYND